MVLTQRELKNAYLGEYTLPLPNAGPCSAGFHIPMGSENPMETLWGMGLSGDTTEMGVYLHIPPMGTLHPTNASKQNLGSECALWSCKGGSDGAAEAFSDWNVGPAKSAGIPIRPFKDTPVAPDSSRTQTYDGSSETGISGTGIFYKASAGLITMSSDAQNWITIADKNVGATTVYNNGDTMSQANCGNYYQRGNNYGFPFTGPTTTSSTLVDASGYGPSNPYSSSTFIFGQKPSMMAMGEDWSSVANNNLWGGEGREPNRTALLSQGGTINRFSELTLYGGYIGLWDRATYWNGYVGTTDKYGFHYKVFDKRIIGFRINMVTQSPSGEYPGLRFWIFKDTSGFGTGDRPGISNCIYGNATSQVYQGSATGTFSFSYNANGTSQNLVNQNKTNSASDLTYVGNLKNGVRNISITSTDGESWSGTYTPDSSIQDLYGIALRGERRYTGNTGQFNSVEIVLEE